MRINCNIFNLFSYKITWDEWWELQDAIKEALENLL